MDLSIIYQILNNSLGNVKQILIPKVKHFFSL